MERDKERVAQTHAAYADYLAVKTVRRPQPVYNHAIKLDLDSLTPVRRPHQFDWSPTIENKSFDHLGDLSSLPSTEQYRGPKCLASDTREETTNSNESSHLESLPSVDELLLSVDTSLKNPKDYRTSNVIITTKTGPLEKVVQEKFVNTAVMLQKNHIPTTINVPENALTGPKLGVNQGVGRQASAGPPRIWQNKRTASELNANEVLVARNANKPFQRGSRSVC